jgi:hypothetical protein
MSRSTVRAEKSLKLRMILFLRRKWWFIYSRLKRSSLFVQNKKKTEAEGKNCHAETMLSFGKADKAYMKDTPHVPLRQIDEE